jgi:hypothetical protein
VLLDCAALGYLFDCNALFVRVRVTLVHFSLSLSLSLSFSVSFVLVLVLGFSLIGFCLEQETKKTVLFYPKKEQTNSKRNNNPLGFRV